jgi:hypothetical protein
LDFGFWILAAGLVPVMPLGRAWAVTAGVVLPGFTWLEARLWGLR